MVPTTPQQRLPLSPCHITGSTGLQQETGLPCWLTPTPCHNLPRNVPREGLAPPHTAQGDWYARASYDMLVVTLLQGQVQEAPFLQSSKCSSHGPQTNGGPWSGAEAVLPTYPHPGFTAKAF